MTRTGLKLLTGFLSTLLVVSYVPTAAFAETHLEISGNGSGSTNTTDVDISNTSTVVQSNSANISNNVYANGSTGGNTANDNTGGDVMVRTGDATTEVDVTTKANLNKAEIDSCECLVSADLLISGNGSGSWNNADLDLKNSAAIFQDNSAYINNNVYANSNSGNNNAKRNTGGDVAVVTGNADADVSVKNAANVNLASIGENGDGNNGAITARIIGNGSGSVNTIDLNVAQNSLISQYNDAWVRNWVEVNANTGHNRVNDNTGGDVTILTGDARARADVDTKVNFNAASLDCGCISDVLAKISGNGSGSYNFIDAWLGSDSSVFQDNWSDIYNDVHANGQTGDNKAKRNTGDPNGTDDPFIWTGDVDSMTHVTTWANANIAGPDVSTHLPTGVNFDFHFDLHDLLSHLQVG